MPTISIGLCTFNGERFLREQLDSIESQTLLPYEVVACDDGSTDATISILREFAGRARFPVRIIENEQRLGVSANFAKAVSECRGDYFAPCDQDDIWLPERLETFAALLTKHPYGLVFSDAFLLDEKSRSLNSRAWQSFGVRRREIKRFTSGRALELLVERTLVTGATMILSRDLLDVAFPLPANLPKPIIQDGWLALVAAARGEIAAVPKPLMFYRRHAAQQGGVPNKKLPFWQRIGSWFHSRKEQRAARVRRHREYLNAAVAKSLKLEELLADRLGGSGTWRSLWAGAANHLRWRQNLPENFLRRFTRVVFRAALGAYLRYSGDAFTDITRDVLYGGNRPTANR
jgi:glycosyltransferase involved in cell wall biosynthesis